MAELTTYTCDECGRRKGEANHWFIADVGERSFMITKWDQKELAPGTLHLCGLECATKAMHKAMSE